MRTHQRMLIALRSGVSSCQWFWGMKDVFLVLGKGPCARQRSGSVHDALLLSRQLGTYSPCLTSVCPQPFALNVIGMEVLNSHGDVLV
jgi:hypothetical protein